MFRIRKRVFQQTFRVKDLFWPNFRCLARRKKEKKRGRNSKLDEELVLTERIKYKYRFVCFALDYIVLFLL